MATVYPSTLPQPLVDGFSAVVASGAIRSDMPMHQAQRRVYKTMPHAFTLTFIMSVTEWGEWYQWVNTYGFRWFEMELPSMYAGRLDADVSALLIRFTSAISAVNVSATDVQIAMTAELAPSAISAWLDNT